MRQTNNRRLAIGIIAAAVTGAAAHQVLAETTSEFYRGKTVTIIVGTAAGGGYDAYARLIAAHLSKQVPGNPNVIVQNMPGAGSVVAANHIYNVAHQDGTILGTVNSALPFQPLLEAKTARFDPTKVNWLPVPTGDVATVVVWHGSGINSIDDARRTEVLVGSGGTVGSTSFYPRVLNDVLGTKLKLITGYTGGASAFLAMERGELHGHPVATWSSLKTVRGDWIKDGKLKFLVYDGAKREPELDSMGVPFAPDLVHAPEDKLVLEIATGTLGVGRPYMMGPGVPQDRVAAMRKAFEAMFDDAGFRSDADKRRMEVSPLTAQEVMTIIEKTYSAPPPVIERLRALYNADAR